MVCTTAGESVKVCAATASLTASFGDIGAALVEAEKRRAVARRERKWRIIVEEDENEEVEQELRLGEEEDKEKGNRLASRISTFSIPVPVPVPDFRSTV